MGWSTVAFVERDKFCQRVLRKNFGQDIEIHDDITTFSGKPFRGRVDVVTGGFPCQPFSAAGKRKGRTDERHLFPQMLRVIREVRPLWVVAENVRGLLSIESGSVFSEVISSLEGEGYEVVTFCVPASAVNALHRRDRLWIVAKSSSERCDDRGDYRSGRHVSLDGRTAAQDQQERQGRKRRTSLASPTDTNTHQPRPQRRNGEELCECADEWTSRPRSPSVGHTAIQRLPDRFGGEMGQPHPVTEFERPGGREIERDFRGVAHGVSARVDRLKSLGNSIVPQIAFEIFKAIEQTESAQIKGLVVKR
jgi:DNA (cytosine-5)-methyltransferase 1